MEYLPTNFTNNNNSLRFSTCTEGTEEEKNSEKISMPDEWNFNISVEISKVLNNFDKYLLKFTIG